MSDKTVLRIADRIECQIDDAVAGKDTLERM